jgi:hypothetical protein
VELCHRPVMARGTAWSQGAIPAGRLIGSSHCQLPWITSAHMVPNRSLPPLLTRKTPGNLRNDGSCFDLCTFLVRFSNVGRWVDRSYNLARKGIKWQHDPRLSCLYMSI